MDSHNHSEAKIEGFGIIGSIRVIGGEGRGGTDWAVSELQAWSKQGEGITGQGASKGAARWEARLSQRGMGIYKQAKTGWE